jgi:outer membrane protein G
MKKIITSLFLLAIGFTQANAQTKAYTGAGDSKFQIGASFQKNGTGIVTTYDVGVGESFSIGAQAGYILGYKELPLVNKPGFGDRFDLKARFNANLGSVIGLPENVDLYPGLNLGLKNFGAHVGGRVFFAKGFGLFAEAQFPIARYNSDAINYKLLNNQFAVNAGVSFDLGK